MAFKVVPVSKFEAPEPGFSGFLACCRDVRRSLSSSPPSLCFQPVSPPLRLWWFRGPAPRGLGPFPAPVPPLPSFVFVPAPLLVACLAALVLEVSFERSVSESSWETAFSDDKFVTGMATRNETDSLNSVWQSPKFNLPGSFHMKEEHNLKALSHQFWKDFYLRFLQASWEVELLII